MTFVFQDSTEMPMQRNFVDDLNNFLELVEKILPVENKAIELNTRIRKEEDRYANEALDIGKFNKEFTDSLDQLSKHFSIDPIERCGNKLKEYCTSCLEKQKEQAKTALDDLTRRSRDEVAKMAKQIHSELEPFLWSGVYGVNKTWLITGNMHKVTGSLKMNISGLFYKYDLKYADVPLYVKKLMEGVSIPVWSKSGLFHKEEQITQLDLSEYIIKRIYSGDDFQLDIENRKGTKKVNIRVPAEIRHASVIYIEDVATDITTNEELSPKMDYEKLEQLVLKAKEYIENEVNIASKTLLAVEIDEKDAIANNEIFESIKIVASQYGEIIKDLLNHGFTKNEIVIKEIIEDRTRNEIFISVNEISNRLSALGGDGLELKDLLNLN